MTKHDQKSTSGHRADAGNGIDAARTRSGNGNGNGNGRSRYDVGEPEYFLPAILAGDPILYLVDGDGNLIDAEGNSIDSDGTGVGLSPGLRRLQIEAMAIEEPESPKA